MGIKKIIKMFEHGNCCVVGLRGTGKDMLFANVACRRRLPYVSNTDYGGNRYPFEYDKIRCGDNTFNDFITGNLTPYTFPYPDKTDIYLADVGVYFPSQYCGILNNKYSQVSTFMALSRHLGLSNVHFNVQNLNRAWDKLREQSDTYILCRSCKVLFGRYVFQRVTVYDKYDSCVQRVKPFSLSLPFISTRDQRQLRKLEKQRFEQTYGEVRNMILIYKNLSSYDTRVFKTMLGGDNS